MKRRAFITLIGSAAAVWSSRAHAEQPAMPTIGYLSAGSELEARPQRDAFRSGLVDLGYTEGKNIRVLYRYAEGKAERLSVLASEMVSLGTMAILAGGTTAIRAAHEAAPNVPILRVVAPIQFGRDGRRHWQGPVG